MHHLCYCFGLQKIFLFKHFQASTAQKDLEKKVPLEMHKLGKLNVYHLIYIILEYLIKYSILIKREIL